MSSIRAAAIGAFVLVALAQPSLAQTYPTQNVTVIVAFPAGGLADIIGRLVSTKLETRLKQSVVVENRAGAGGNIAAKAVTGAAPDGHTLLATTSGLAANMTASKNKGFEQGDLRPGTMGRTLGDKLPGQEYAAHDQKAEAERRNPPQLTAHHQRHTLERRGPAVRSVADGVPFEHQLEQGAAHDHRLQ